MSIATETLVLNQRQIEQRIARIAWEIYELHHNEAEITLAGIANRGLHLAKLLEKEIKKISPLKVVLGTLSLDKENPLSKPITYSGNTEELENRCIIVVDDVLNSGRTLIYGVNYFLKFNVKRITTVVLVDRSHKRFPVKADIKGISLSTSMQETVLVKLEEGKAKGVYLT